MSKLPIGSDDERSLEIYMRQIENSHPLPAHEEVRLARRIKKGDKLALEKLTKANLRFVVFVAIKYQNQGMTLADLINEGNLGLIKAAKRFDGALGYKFISYAVWWIRQAILYALAEQSRIYRLPLSRVEAVNKTNKASARLEQGLGRQPSPDEIAIELNYTEHTVSEAIVIQGVNPSLDAPYSETNDSSLNDSLKDKHTPAADEILHARELKELIEQTLDTLTAREAEVIKLYFGLDHEKRHTLEEIGVRYSLTRERVRQIKEKAIKRLRHASRSRALRPYLHK